MTNIKDLCERLPYGLKVQYTTGDGMRIDCGIDMVSIASECVGIYELGTSKVVWRGIEYIKPYLRPMSSMTEEEEKVFSEFLEFQSEYVSDADLDNKTDMYDWLNAHHFDYRGLIEKGLALEAPADMYK